MKKVIAIFDYITHELRFELGCKYDVQHGAVEDYLTTLGYDINNCDWMILDKNKIKLEDLMND